jgi:alginate O-acetyltransferase complex protein AlgI
MVFSDPVFLYIFLPLCLAAYWAGGWRRRNHFLIAAGTVFYLSGGGVFVLLLLGTILVNHLGATAIGRWRDSNRARARSTLITVIALDLASLAVYKYGGFAANQAATLLRHFGVHATWTLQLALPIAISFYTFQCISYAMDVWHGTAPPAARLVDFAAYILLFPHLIAGPIVRFADIRDDLLAVPRRRAADFSVGAPRFFWGLAKKVIIADQVAAISNAVFAPEVGTAGTTTVWLGALAFAVQIYFDFSGYSDMAIGLARMFGFHFPENFDRPYSAQSLTDFWRRWHISLSSWFRDYLYIPLGGNRRGAARTYLNLAIVFALTGFWHGANWTFLVWGAFHGVGLVIERITGLGVTRADRWSPLRRLVTFVVVCVGWVLFRAGNLGQGVRYIRAMFVPNGGSIPFSVQQYLTTQRIVWLCLGLCIALLPGSWRLGAMVSEGDGRRARTLRLATIGVLAPIACMYTLSSSFSPFLYFKF